jgi:hypothetical protein
MDKSFTQYLIESTKTYSFKLKIAGELEEGLQTKIHDALHKFSPVSISTGKRTPIQEVPLDFPELENTRVTVWDIEIKYPTTTQVLQNYISNTLDYPIHCVKVSNCNEPLEHYQQENSERSEEILNNPNMGIAEPKVHELVGEKRVTGLLKDIINSKRMTGEVYTGVNDEILAKSSPVGACDPVPTVTDSKSILGSQKREPLKGK